MPGQQYYVALAKVAAQQSNDPSTRTGAVIVGPDGEVRSTGYNGWPIGVEHGSWDRPDKYLWTEHAERNAIFLAARVGTPLKGCILYSWTSRPLSICADCGRAIIQAGITKVVQQMSSEATSHWENSNLVAMQMFDEAGVDVVYY